MISTVLKNSILALTLSASITGVDSQPSKSSPPKPDCYFVVRSWQLLGRTVPSNVSSTDNGCCTVPMTGVTCDPSNRVTDIVWPDENLQGSIPSEIFKLTDLRTL